MSDKNNRVKLFKLLEVVAFISFVISAIIIEISYLPTNRSKIFITLGYLPLGLVGIISFINPLLFTEASNAFNSEDKEKKLKHKRRLGLLWFLLAATLIFNTWN